MARLKESANVDLKKTRSLPYFRLNRPISAGS
jgi:hypothetical protein